jgi:transposase-like protein
MMECPYCEHPKVHKHSQTTKKQQRYRCPNCNQTFTDTLDTLYYRRQLTPTEVEYILQAHSEGVSLRGIARLSKRAYNTVVSVIREASQKAQMIHNEEVKEVETEQIIADEMWSFVKKTEKLPC